MGDVQPEAVLDLEALLPYSIVITSLQCQKHPALTDAQRQCFEDCCLYCFLLPCCNKTKCRNQFMERRRNFACAQRGDGV